MDMSQDAALVFPSRNLSLRPSGNSADSHALSKACLRRWLAKGVNVMLTIAKAHTHLPKHTALCMCLFAAVCFDAVLAVTPQRQRVHFCP